MRALVKVRSLLKSELLSAPLLSLFWQTGVPSNGAWEYGFPGRLGPSQPHCCRGSTEGVRSTTVESAKMRTRCAPRYGVITALSARATGFATVAAMLHVVTTDLAQTA